MCVEAMHQSAFGVDYIFKYQLLVSYLGKVLSTVDMIL